MHEYDFPPSGKNHVRLTRKIVAMQPEAIAHPVRQPAHHQLRTSIRTLHSAHNAAALFSGLFHRRSSIFRLGLVSSTISLYHSTKSLDCALGKRRVQHNSFSTADAPGARSGDFFSPFGASSLIVKAWASKNS